MKIKEAYYLRGLPTLIAVTLEDGSHRVTNLTPFRLVEPKELRHLAAFDSGMRAPAQMGDPIPHYVLRFYGFTKV